MKNQHAVKRNIHKLKATARAKAAAERKHQAAVKRVAADAKAVKATNEKKIADLKAQNASIDATVAKCAAGGPCPAKISATGKTSAPRRASTKAGKKKASKKAGKKKASKKAGKKKASKKAGKKKASKKAGKKKASKKAGTKKASKKAGKKKDEPAATQPSGGKKKASIRASTTAPTSTEQAERNLRIASHTLAKIPLEGHAGTTIGAAIATESDPTGTAVIANLLKDPSRAAARARAPITPLALALAGRPLPHARSAMDQLAALFDNVSFMAALWREPGKLPAKRGR